jgi:hypothetical protein
MLEFAKLLHDVFGSHWPRTFISVAAIVGALIFGGTAWLLVIAARKTAERNPVEAGDLFTKEKRPPSMIVPDTPPHEQSTPIENGMPKENGRGKSSNESATSQEPKRENHRPEFTDKDIYHVTLGASGSMPFPAHGTTYVNMMMFNDQPLVTGRIENGRLLINAKVYGGHRTGPVEVTGNEITLNNSNWDRNYNDTALEVVNPDGYPMLQIIYKTPHNVVVYGFFYFSPTEVTAITPKTSGPTGDLIPYDQIGQGTHALKRLFKYPSRLHFHEEEPD